MAQLPATQSVKPVHNITHLGHLKMGNKDGQLLNYLSNRS